jgi:predicted small lipoprotein YifL
MLRKLLPAIVLVLLTLAGCGKDGGTATDPTGGGGEPDRRRASEW